MISHHNTSYHKGLTSSSAHKLHLIEMTHVQDHLKFSNKHFHDLESGHMRPKWSSLATTRTVMFGRREMLLMTQRTPSPLSSMQVEFLFIVSFLTSSYF